MAIIILSAGNEACTVVEMTMLKGSHKIALMVGVAIFLGLITVDMVPGPWKKKANSVRQNEAQAAFLRASNLKPQQLAKARSRPIKASIWGIF